MASIISLFKTPAKQESRFTELVKPHVDVMFRMAYRWTQQTQEAEDLVQDVLTRLVNRVNELERVDNLKPWLIKILYRRFVDLYRREQNNPIELEHQWMGNEDIFEQALHNTSDESVDHHRSDLQRMLLKALETLEDEQRDVVLLHDVEGYSAIEVADIMDISVGTVKSRLHRSRAKLKNYLQEGTI